ncbi:MAG TPA: hypothetical protein DCL61_16570 [Cyanobacteria bacterium UBA12227]|nr:hypothetical protein [Cyanobacteria bacterium UBA12227]HAX88082.1 hypothetical protein [Cyanobacteria bacterium UBA11370]HBY79340.1 hypothetical protein [Cyanobacteria bacterium UBA11148]
MAENLIETTVNPKQLKFKPGGAPGSFEVTVVNESDRFATFQLEVTAAGTDGNQRSDWYSISPEVSTKKPPGDFTKFHILILDTPVPGFVGMMNLTVRVFSLELPDEDREVVRLNLEAGTGSVVLKLELPVREFEEYPGNQDEIPVRIYNPGQLPTNVTLKFSGLDPRWIVDGTERHLQLPAGGQTSELFICQIPADLLDAPSQIYPFKIEAIHSNGPSSWVEGTFHVLPMGVVEFTNKPDQHQIPAKLTWLPNWRNPPVTYDLEFENRSNLHQQVSVEIQGDDQQQCTLELPETQAELDPGETQSIPLGVKARRHWLGRKKKLFLEAVGILSDQRLGTTNPSSQILKLDVFPIIPMWLLLSGGLLFLFLAWWLSGLNPNNRYFGHQDAVNSVEFNGMSQNVVSASNDQTLIKWRVDGFFNPFANPEVGEIADTGKAVRVIRYKPVNNNLVAAGLENGEIQLLNLLAETPELVDSFSYQKDDRVLALEFTDDSRYLFSGHGSGLVLLWDVQQNLDDLSSTVESTSKQPLRRGEFDFAVYALKFVGPNNTNLAIAGRFNQFVIWNLSKNALQRVDYPQGGQNDYIFSMDTAQLKPYLLATADNQGRIILWDMQKCLVRNQPCEPIDQWSNGHSGKPVRSVALSNGGCYLASGGDDGRMMLWPLTREGRRAEQFITGKRIGRSFNNKKFNSIDINVLNDDIYIASGSDDTQVRVKRTPRLQRLGCDRD